MKYRERNAWGRRFGETVCAVCLFCILWSCGYGGTALANPAENGIEEQRTVLGSKLYDSKEEVPSPAAEFIDEAGRLYGLRSWKVETVPVKGREELVSGEILYYGVMRDVQPADEAEFQVKDERSGSTVSAMLPLEEIEFTNERWEDDLSFTATFHQYGADGYYLGERELQGVEYEDPSLYNEELLALIGMNPDSCRIERWEWAGGPYADEAGVLCRDAAVYGKILVYDCRAVHRGRVKLPDYERFCMNAVYELQREEQRESEEATRASDAKAHTSDVRPDGEQKMKHGFWETMFRVVKKSLKLTVLLLLPVVLFIGFRALVRAARKLDRQWKDTDERDR